MAVIVEEKVVSLSHLDLLYASPVTGELLIAEGDFYLTRFDVDSLPSPLSLNAQTLLMEGLRRIFEIAERLDDPLLNDENEKQVERELRAEVQVLWKTDEVRAHKPEVKDEIANGLFYFQESLFEAVPDVYRMLEKGVRRIYGTDDDGFPLVEVPSMLRFGSWIGGDRDGNPFVKPRTTRLALRSQSRVAFREYIKRVVELSKILSHSSELFTPTRRMEVSLEADSDYEARALGDRAYRYENVPYRRKLYVMRYRLEQNLGEVEARLEGRRVPDSEDAYPSEKELLDDLYLIRDTLIQTGDRIIAGGKLQDLIRLVETLLYRGEVTPILMAIARARAAGAMIVGVGGAASALSGFMIGGGTSYEALRFGIASDMGRRGLVIQEGLGLFGAAIVDQKLGSSRRLGRLAVACAEEGVRFGLGLLEDSGVIANHDNSKLTAIGARGAVLVEIDPLKTELAGDDFIAPGTRLCLAGPGDVIDMEAGTVTRLAPATASAAVLDTLVAELIEECVGNAGPVTAPGVTHEAHVALFYNSNGDGTGDLDIESIRDRHG